MVKATDAEALTGSVLTVNCAVVFPAVTVMGLVGTFTMAALLLLRATLTPPAGAGPVKVTVPCTLVLATTEVGFTVTLLSCIVLLTVRAGLCRVAPR